MVTNFEFASAARLIFGTGRIAELPILARPFGERAMVVTGADPARWLRHVAPLRQQGMVVTHYPINNEPNLAAIEAGVEKARAGKCQMVVALGGGSVMDTGKAIAALAPNPGKILDYLEVIGKAQPLTEPGLPI